MGEDVLKKKVHLVLVKETLLQTLEREGRVESGTQPKKVRLPIADPKPSMRVNRLPIKVGDIRKQSLARGRLRVAYDSIEPIPADKVPDCGACKTAACCSAFIVNIEPEEYDTGLYSPYAIELTETVKEQLRSRLGALAMSGGISTLSQGTSYVMEGLTGQPCPFLGDDNNCSIYNDRPYTCRVYTCVDDPRITEGMRQGTEPLVATLPEDDDD